VLGHFPRCERVIISQSSSRVPKPPGKTMRALAICANHNLRIKKIMEIEAELGTDVRIRELLVGQFDGKADRFAAGFIGAAIGSFHDAGALRRNR